MKERKKSLPLALLLSFLVCVLGAVVWGLVYSLGYFTTIVSALAVMCAIMVYQIFHKVNWLTYVWTIVWVVLLNEISMLIAITIAVMQEAGAAYTFAECFSAVVQIIGEGGEAGPAFATDSAMNVLFSLLGGVIEIFAIRNQAKRKKMLGSTEFNDTTIHHTESTDSAENSNSNTKTNSKNNLEADQTNSNKLSQKDVVMDEKYNSIVNSCVLLIDIFNTDKDREKFKHNIMNLKEKMLSNLTNQEKTYFQSKIELEQQNINLQKNYLSALKILSKFLNSK